MLSRRLFSSPFLNLTRVMSNNAAAEVLTTSVGDKRVITLNRPKALNALNLPMVRTLYPMLKKWNSEQEVSMVILRGAGDKAFCAGGDVVAVTKSARSNDPKQTVHKDFFREEYLLNHEIGSCPMPFVAVIDGITMGGGCGLSINGRFRVATERTMLAMPETALGLFPDVGGSFFLPRLRCNLGVFLALTGHRLQGADVYHAGLATHYIRSSWLKDLTEELLKIPSKEVNKDSVDYVLRKFQGDIPKFTLDSKLAEIEKLFDASTVEQIFDNLRKSDSEFAKKQLTVLSKMSPTSMKVTLRQVKEGAKMEFADVFTMEYRLTQRFMAGHDFHEGCRAILIDKDRKPVWNPSSLEGVTDAAVDAYFAPLPKGEDLFIRELKARV